LGQDLPREDKYLSNRKLFPNKIDRRMFTSWKQQGSVGCGLRNDVRRATVAGSSQRHSGCDHSKQQWVQIVFPKGVK